ANFNLQSRDISTGLVCDLVNEGFGTNQLVTILTKSLRKEMRTICIEESEIHLHPELMDKLVNVFIDIAKEEEKNFIISTHSEHIVLSLLNKIKQGKIAPNEVKVYYFHATRRCETCLAVENVSIKAVEEYYGDKVFFESINRETDKLLVNKYQISGQTLLIIKGDKKVDLTNDAFLNALSNPDKLKSKIKSTIDSMM
ncbi:MAG: nitrophenyl compound nitroreductase subunit ArsF family protein, partial [Bacteroidota bacterium]